MALLQVSRLEVALSQRQLEVSRLELTVPSITATRKLHVARLEAVANAGAAPVLSNGTVTPAGPVDALTDVAMSVTVSGSYTTISWVQQAGSPTVSPAGLNTPTINFAAPATQAGSTVTFAVNATGPGGTSNAVLLAVQVRAQVHWFLDASGVWRPVGSSAEV